MKKINANILIIIISVACTVLLAVILLIAIFIQGGERRETAGEQTPRLRVEAEKTSAAGTRTDSAFFITGENGVLPPQAIKEALRLAPEFPYHWEETAAGLLLRPDAPLASDTVYRFFTDAGHAQSWAFQTEGRFSVRSLRPEANAAQVPLQPEIEISFSRPPANISGWVEIDPAITGDWRRNGLTAAFLPAAPLRPDTLYTVTLRAGLPGMTGETLAEDYVFSFRTEHGDGSENQFLEIEGRFTETFLPDDPVAIRFQVMGGDFSGAKVSAAVYEVRDSAAYLALALAQTERVKPLCGRNSDVLIEPPAPAAPPDFVTEGVLLATASPGVLYFLPELNLDPGYYLLDMTVSGPATATAARRQKLICVSALSVYMQNPRGQTQFWINDAASGRPLAGAEITVAPTGAGVSLTAVTNADGLASLDASPAGAEPALTVKAADGRAWADLAPLAAGASGPAEPPPSQRYYSYLYFDRAAYLSADTAHFWGYLAPRRDGYELPAAVTVSLPGLPPQTAPVHRGAFSGVFSWQSLAPGQHEAELSLAGETVFSLPLLISGTEKPVYIIKAAAEKNLYRRGEKAAITATAAFFDGAPAAGLRLTAENGAASQAQTVNAAGSAAFALPEPEPDSWRPYLDRVSLRADENETAAVAVSVCRFPTDYMCEIKTEVAPGGFFLEVSTARIDFAAAEAALAAGGTAVTAPDLPERIRGEAYEQYFDAGVIRCEYLPEESGEYYDFFQKQTVKQYRYVYRESLAERLSFSTSDGRYRSELLPWQADGLVFYKVSLDYETPDGAVLREYTADIPLPSPPPATDGYRLETAKTDFTVGESLTLRPRNTLSPLPRDGRLFYAVTGDEAVVAEVTEETEFSLYCAEALLPNFDITAAYFDGKHVFPLTGPAFVFDPAERALRVEIRPERETYAPGETLNAEIKVTDASGQPRAASFIFSLADEAAFTAQEQQADAAAALYRPLVREIAGQFASYTPHAFAGVSPPAGDAPPQPAEAAAAGSAAGSEQALPTPVFLSGETDGGGRARISCQLPADMADWRLTVVACTEIGQAGDARAAVSATRPFYLRPDFSQRYTTRDDIVIVLRAGGVLPETAVSYRARVESADGAAAAEQSLSAAAASAAVCDFGKLPAGEYVFSVTAAAGGEREEAAYPFLVAESLLDSPALTESDPAGLAKTAALNYPADIFFYDGSNKLYARILLELAGAAGARADERAAADYIRAAFAGTEPEGSSAGAQARGGINPAEAESGPAGVSVRPEAAGGRLPAEYVDPAGGLRLLPHSGPDSLLTARAVAAAPGCVNPEQTREYFYGILSQGGAEPAETAAAYLGLSALGAPVLTDIHALLPNRGAEFSLRDCLRLAAGLALLGDGAGAAAWYEEFIAPLAVAADETLFIDAGAGDAEDIYALTAEAAMLASLTGHSQAAPLLVYVLEREGAYSPLFELMTVLRLTPAPAGGGAVLRYKTASGEVSVDLGAEAVHRLSLSQKQLTAAGFRAEGDVRAAALHPAAAGLSPDSSGKITITKTYVPRGGLIQVTIDVHLQNNAPLPLYTLADTLPAGLRFAGVEAGGQGDWYLSGENGGRVDFVLNRVRENEGAQIEILADFQVTYLARAVLPGEFLADSAEARHADSGLRGATVPVLQTFQLAR